MNTDTTRALSQEQLASLGSPMTDETNLSQDLPDHHAHIPKVEPLSSCRAPWKRTLDLLFSFCVLAFGFPVFGIIAILVRATSRGPILYKAKRVGLGGEMFLMYKFRSMYMDADDRLKEVWDQNQHDGPVFKIRNDPRITPLGRVLRRLSLDEIPQFMNILLGQMSLVGPRALHAYEVVKFDDAALERLQVKPGLTCYWQVLGRSDLSFDEWMELDRRYIREMSLLTDLRILARTPAAVLRGEGAY